MHPTFQAALLLLRVWLLVLQAPALICAAIKLGLPLLDTLALKPKPLLAMALSPFRLVLRQSKSLL
jgi:hypothetical protein